jgi:hypothetical protein
MTLPDGNSWHVRIDKLACDQEGNYYVCDYKTNSRIKDQEEADEDRQLALYSIWVKDKFKDVKSVKLVWHMLAFNKEAVSERSDEQLEKLQEEVCETIKKIESAKEFPRTQSGLCNYCVYKGLCPSFKHEVELEAKVEVKKFKEDEGVQLVDDYSNVRFKMKELEEQEEKLKVDLIEFAKQKGVDVIYGSNMKAGIKEFDKLVMPEGEEKEAFIKLMKDRGVYEECSMVCYPKLNSRVLKGDIHADLKEKCEIVRDVRVSLSKRKDLEDE